jgi:hypothetical protein
LTAYLPLRLGGLALPRPLPLRWPLSLRSQATPYSYVGYSKNILPLTSFFLKHLTWNFLLLITFMSNHFMFSYIYAQSYSTFCFLCWVILHIVHWVILCQSF